MGIVTEHTSGAVQSKWYNTCKEITTSFDIKTQEMVSNDETRNDIRVLYLSTLWGSQ